MRLGDLDALKEDIVKLCRQINASNGITVPALAFTRVIDNAPTVDIKDIYQEGYYDGHLEGYTKAINEGGAKMTCKDCIHSGLCYKENDYENFPDRCGSFIPERPQGEWKLIRVADHCGIHDSFVCPFCNYEREYRKENFCEECGADLRGEKADENS